MSQRIKRLTKKIKTLSENFERESAINKAIDEMYVMIDDLSNLEEESVDTIINDLQDSITRKNRELDKIWKEYESIMAYVYKEGDANVGYDTIQLLEGIDLDLTILETEDIVMVASNGLIGKAKRHEQDKFDFEIGYRIALHRLIGKVLNKLYGYGGE